MKIRVGTRGSLLAVTQTNLVADSLQQSVTGLEVEVRTYVTSGDKKQDKPHDTPRDKKEWIIELEQALLAKEIDLAVHSSKDVPIDIAAGTLVQPILERQDPRDILILSARGKNTLGNRKLSEISEPLQIATSSLRRERQLKLLNGNIKCSKMRGNITTRISKLADSDKLDGIVLARAGVSRLNLQIEEVYPLSIEEMIPAVNQGSLLIQIREEDHKLKQIVSSMSTAVHHSCWEAERIVIEELGADCRSALGVYAWVEGDSLHLRSRVTGEGKNLEYQSEGNHALSDKIALAHAKTLLDRGAADLI
jgi:hydroxymethylbilane synthase